MIAASVTFALIAGLGCTLADTAPIAAFCAGLDMWLGTEIKIAGLRLRPQEA